MFLGAPTSVTIIAFFTAQASIIVLPNDSGPPKSEIELETIISQL